MNLTSPKIPLQIKALNKREFEGHGAVFGNVDWGGDTIMPGAFKRTLAEHAGDLPPMFWSHDSSRVPGKWLDMREDEKGLYVKGMLADTDLGSEIYELLKIDAVSGMSIGYMTRESDYTDDGVRKIRDLDLFEVSLVSLPMNPKAQVVHVKSRLSAKGEYVPDPAEIKREVEHILRVKGFSRNDARMMVGNIFKDIGFSETLNPGETGATPEEKNEPGATPESDDLSLSDLEGRVQKHIDSLTAGIINTRLSHLGV